MREVGSLVGWALDADDSEDNPMTSRIWPSGSKLEWN